MITIGSRIRTLSTRFASISDGTNIIIGLTDLNRFEGLLAHFGFSSTPADGETVLPPASFGPVSLYNSEGRDIVHRDQPMETAYRQAKWQWVEWHGRYDQVEQSRIVDVPYQRYPRTFDPPPSVEMTMTSDAAGNRVLVTTQTQYVDSNHSRILHTVNLFLEIFRECNIMDENLQSIHMPQIRRVHWRILPQGKMPWDRLNLELRPVIERQPQGNQPVIRYRLQAVNRHEPEFVAVGQGGFDGYVIFAFPQQHLFLLECVHFGNATYVFGDDWETLAQMTKAEILDENLQRARLIHRESWEAGLNDLFRADNQHRTNASTRRVARRGPRVGKA